MSDRKIPVQNGTTGIIASFKAEVINAQDYYAFGSIMPGRSYTSSSGYRYGYQGQEKDDETKGSGNSINFGNRIYDPRLGRMFSRDRYNALYPCLSPYNSMGNDPISGIDINGDLIIFVNGLYLGHDYDCYIELQDYWDVKLKANAAASLHDYDAVYFNASENPVFSNASDRQSKGAKMGIESALMFKKILDAERKSNVDAKLNFVSHSMGGAYATGMINALSVATYPDDYPDEGLRGKNIFGASDFGDAYFLAPYQSDEIQTPAATQNKQFSHTNDFAAFDAPIKGIFENRGKYISTYFPTLSTSLFDVLTPHFNSTFKGVFPIRGTAQPINNGGIGGDKFHNELHKRAPAPSQNKAPADNTRTSHDNVRRF